MSLMPKKAPSKRVAKVLNRPRNPSAQQGRVAEGTRKVNAVKRRQRNKERLAEQRKRKG